MSLFYIADNLKAPKTKSKVDSIEKKMLQNIWHFFSTLSGETIDRMFSNFCIIPTADNCLISFNRIKSSCFLKLDMEYLNLEEVLLRLGIEIVDLSILEKEIQGKMSHFFQILEPKVLVRDLATNERNLILLNSDERRILRISLANLLSDVRHKILDPQFQSQLRLLPIFETFEGNFFSLESILRDKHSLVMPPTTWFIPEFSTMWLKYLNEEDEKFLLKIGVSTLSIESCFIQTIEKVLV